MTDVVTQRRERLAADLTQLEQMAQRAQAVLQEAAVKAERLRGAIALCDELLTVEREADQPEVA